MNPQQIVDLARLKLDAALAFNTRQITEEQYASIHNTGAMLTGEAGLLIPGRVVVDRGNEAFATIRSDVTTILPPNNIKKRGK